jgi:thiol-disulfide isomerase/thioredoxin
MLKKLFLAFFLGPFLVTAQHFIKGTFSPPEDYKWAILYRVTPTNTLYTTDTKVDEAGNFTLKLDSTVGEGIYRLVYAIPQDVYNFDIIYNAKEDIEFSFNDTEGIVYSKSEENRLLAAYENEMSLIQAEIGKNYTHGSEVVNPLFKALEELQLSFEKAGTGMIALDFIKANRPYIPESWEDKETYLANSKSTYFNHIDFTNPTLQKSNFLPEAAFNYIRAFVGKDENVPVAYENNIDVICTHLGNTTPEFQKVFLIRLWQIFADINQIQTSNYIAEKYLIPISKLVGDFELADKLTVFKNISFGEKAPDFTWEEDIEGKKVTKSLRYIDVANNYILVFWSSGCSHCLKEVPLLHSKIKELKPGEYKVIAIGLEDEPYDWQNKIHDFPEFINVLGLGKWENKIGNDYGVDATPVYFVLDKEKRIKERPEDYGALLKILEK